MTLKQLWRTVGQRWRVWMRRTPREWFWALQRRFRPNRPFQVPFDGDMKLQVRLRDELGFGYALQREFEPDLGEFFRRFLKPGMVVLDVGANIGHYTLLAAKRVYPGGFVHAFEPAPAEYHELNANVGLNRLENVLANQLAICDREGEATLQICQGGLGLYNSLGAPLREGNVVSVQVRCTTLDSYVRSAGIGKVDLLKMDVEGAELAAIRGAAALLEGPDAPIVVCEFCDAAAVGMGHSTRELRQALEGFGYRLYRYSLETHALIQEPIRDKYQYDNLICCKDKLPL